MRSEPVSAPWPQRYGLAIAFTAVAAGLRWGIDPWLGGGATLVAFIASVAAAAYFGGAGPAILASLLGFLTSTWLFIEPRGELAIASTHPLALLSIYGLSCAAVTAVGLSARWRRARAEHYAAVLESQTERLRRESEDRRAAEIAAREAHQRTQAVLGGITDCVYSVDREWRFTEFNPQAERFFGLRRADVIGRTMWEVFPATVGTDVERTHRQAAAESVPVRYEAVSPSTGKWAEVHLHPTADGITAFFRDITERKRSEEALRASEARFRHLADAMPQVVWIASADGAVRYCNHRISELRGAEQLGDGRWDLIGAVDPEDREATRRSWQEALRSGKPWEIHHRLQLANGARAWFVTRAVPERNEEGTVTRWYGTSTNIDALVKAQESLRMADRRKDEFLATLAHELRNPLAPIRNAVQILKLLGPAEPRVAAAREIIERQVQHMVRLVDDLLDVSRITLGQVTLRHEKVSLAAVLTDALEAVRPTIEAAEHRLTVSLPSDALFVEGDPTRLSQVFQNLLNNAAKYTPNGGEIELRAERRGQEAVVSVRDTGIGIPPQMQQRVFELFARFQPGDSLNTSGLGIGLALAKQMVELHGGSISVYSEGSGKGSEFTVRLPILSTQDARLGPVATSAETPNGSVARRVLVVDDNRDAAVSLAALLELCGCSVRTAFSGREALEVADEFHPELVLLDIGMPELDGYETARRLRKGPGGDALVLVAVTGWGQEEDKERARQAGFDRHLTKPVDPEMLQKLLADAASVLPA